MIGHSEIGGTELQILRTANQMSTRGCKSEVWILSHKGPLNDLASSLNVPVVNFNIDLYSSKFTWIFKLLMIGMRLRKSDFKVIHAFLPGAIMITLPLAHIFAPSIKRIAGVRGSLQKSNFVIDSLYRVILNNSWRIICNAQYLSSILRDKYHINPEKIQVIHNGVSRFEINRITDNKIPTAVVIANFYSYKGHLLLLQVLSHIKTDFRIILCGSGPLREEISKNIKQLNLSSKVAINDSTNNVVESLRSADFAIHPSETEGLSNAILEELSAGLPVIAFEIGGNHELVTSGANGFLIEPFNLVEFQNRIEELINNHALRKKMSLAAAHTSNIFSWDVHINQLLLTYDINQSESFIN